MQKDLNRFIAAQASHYDLALREMRAGKKKSHWIWYIFPQLEGLGYSTNAVYYGITGLQEAGSYLKHPILGHRLVEISQTLLLHKDKSSFQIMGSPDDLKLRSCMTLFAAVPGTDPVFRQVLDMFFSGQEDEKTVAILAGR
jgi:uncharacterized protein (DUF1810 family)